MKKERELLPNRGRIQPDLDVPEDAKDHEEWAIDVAVEQSFPASDASAAVQPGSIASRHAEEEPDDY